MFGVKIHVQFRNVIVKAKNSIYCRITIILYLKLLVKLQKTLIEIPLKIQFKMHFRFSKIFWNNQKSMCLLKLLISGTLFYCQAPTT